ncbi:hypothetical protein AALB16_02885 [Lachnospiraceae bacterium 62-35]
MLVESKGYFKDYQSCCEAMRREVAEYGEADGESPISQMQIEQYGLDGMDKNQMVR